MANIAIVSGIHPTVEPYLTFIGYVKPGHVAKLISDDNSIITDISVVGRNTLPNIKQIRLSDILSLVDNSIEIVIVIEDGDLKKYSLSRELKRGYPRFTVGEYGPMTLVNMVTKPR